MLSQEQGLSFQEFIMSWALDDRRLSNVLKISLMWGHGTHVFHKVIGLVSLTL